MNICFVHHTYPGIGGTEAATVRLAAEYIAKGHNVSVLTWKWGGVNDCYTIGYPVYSLRDASCMDSESNQKQIADYVKHESIDLLINQGPFWTPCKSVTSQCCVISVLHYAPDFRITAQKNAIVEKVNAPGLSPINRLKAYIRRLSPGFFAELDFKRHYYGQLDCCITSSTAFVVLCDAYKAELQQLMGKKYHNLHAIGNGLPEIVFSNLHDKDKSVICMGRLSKWDKRIDRMLHIWSRLQDSYPDWTLKICGDGPERRNLKALALRLKLRNCTFEGFVNADEYYKKASILAMTSSTEGFPMVILEAAQYGVVPIAFNVSSGLEELVSNGNNGYLVPPFDMRDFEQKIGMLMRDSNKRFNMGKEICRLTQRYNISEVADKYIGIALNPGKTKS